LLQSKGDALVEQGSPPGADLTEHIVGSQLIASIQQGQAAGRSLGQAVEAMLSHSTGKESMP